MWGTLVGGAAGAAIPIAVHYATKGAKGPANIEWAGWAGIGLGAVGTFTVLASEFWGTPVLAEGTKHAIAAFAGSSLAIGVAYALKERLGSFS